MTEVFIRRGNLHRQRHQEFAQKDDAVKIQRKDTIYKARREASGETNPTDSLIVDFQLPEM
jgi:hypothetical protein